MELLRNWRRQRVDCAVVVDAPAWAVVPGPDRAKAAPVDDRGDAALHRNPNAVLMRFTRTSAVALAAALTASCTDVSNITMRPTEAESVCSYRVNSASQSFPAVGGVGVFAVTITRPTCAWTATTNVPWIIINGSPAGIGTTNISVNYSVAANSDAVPRTGVITAGDQSVTVHQEASAQQICTYTLSARSQAFNAAGGSGSFTVTSSTGCAWTAVADVPWISIASGAGSGTAPVTYTVVSNPTTAARAGTIAVTGNQTVTITQDGSTAPCSYTLSPVSQSFSASGGSAAVTVTTPPTCSWTATVPSFTWIVITGATSGTGNGVVTYIVAGNSSNSARTGGLVIGGQAFVITQEGVQVNTKDFAVSSGAAWQDTGFDVNVGDQVRIVASGTVRYDSDGRTATPNGSGTGAAMLFSNGTCIYLICGPAIPAGSLVGRIGSSNLADFTSGFFVGTDFNLTVAQSGRLYLGFNDGFVMPNRSGLDSGGVGDNNGSFSTTITITRRP